MNYYNKKMTLVRCDDCRNDVSISKYRVINDGGHYGFKCPLCGEVNWDSLTTKNLEELGIKI